MVRYDSLRAILSCCATKDFEVIQLDVKTAFLHGDLNEELYMEQPRGYVTSQGLVCKLTKSLYGLKQASRTWNLKFHALLLNYGFNQNTADPCVYSMASGIMIAIWVDDGLLCGPQMSELTKIMEYLDEHLTVSSWTADRFVGMENKRDRKKRVIHLSQEQYIVKIIQKFGMQQSASKAVPADPFTHLSVFHSEENEVFDCPYREAIGSLTFAAHCTRPDIAFAVNQAAQHSSSPQRSHWNAVKQILAYLLGTRSLGITFSGDSSKNALSAFYDSDYAGNVDTRRSTSWYLLFLNNGPISWYSKRQKSVALSATEAEYIAMCEASTEITWMRHFLRDIDALQTLPTILLCDNQSAIKLVHNPEFHQRTKHIDVKYHFIRKQQTNGNIDVNYIESQNQRADILTKPLSSQIFNKLRHEMNIN